MPMTTETVDRTSTPQASGKGEPLRGSRRGPAPGFFYRIIGLFRKELGAEDEQVVRDCDDGVEFASRWKLHVSVEEDDLDGGWIAKCTNLPGCMSQGETKEEALEHLNDAIGAVVSARLNSHIAAHEYKTVKGPHGDTVEFEIPV